MYSVLRSSTPSSRRGTLLTLLTLHPSHFTFTTMNFLFNTAHNIDSQIAVAQHIIDLSIWAVIIGGFGYYFILFIDGLDTLVPVPSSPVTTPQALPEATEPVLEPANLEAVFAQFPVADPWERTEIEVSSSWTPTVKPATSLEEILSDVEPVQFATHKQLEELPIRKLKKLAAGRLTNYSRHGKSQLARELKGLVPVSEI